MRINHNISALNAWRNLTITDGSLAKSLEKLSSGYRINKAADDAAGLAISEKMRAQIRGLQLAQRNAQNGISLIQTAEGALNETHAILQRMRELAVQALNGTNTDDDRAALDKEYQQLIDEIDRIANNTEFNTLKLLNGTLANVTLQVGANSGQTMEVTLQSMRAADFSVSDGTTTTTLDTTTISTLTDAEKALTVIDAAIKKVSEFRAELGAYQNRLEHTVYNLGVAAENLTAAESRIRDVDMALEMAEFTKNQILVQSGTAMLAQANMQPQAILKLLQG